MTDANKIVVVVKGVIVNGGKVLIVKRADEDEVGEGTWECVGGKIEFEKRREQITLHSPYLPYSTTTNLTNNTTSDTIA
ncbi:hypothetical protein [Paenibacillus sinopodophylli]|uniref:hypothetical protein n=1 Tax=Paenibacillus sinopodophylli TaxID=1837342 RepID=UPI00319E3D37